MSDGSQMDMNDFGLTKDLDNGYRVMVDVAYLFLLVHCLCGACVLRF